VDDNNSDISSPFTQQKECWKKPRKGNSVTDSSVNDALQSVLYIIPTLFTQCVSPPASSEISLLHNKVDTLL